MIKHFVNTAAFLLAVLFYSFAVKAQYTPNFYKDIEHFKHLDSQKFPEKGEILFIGSSSFTKWTNVHEYFPHHYIINRGFGGSTLIDQIRYANEIIFPYNPRQIVIYCGDNDLAMSKKIAPATVIYRFKTLFGMIRILLPETRIDYVSIKYSPSRQHLWNKITAVNNGIAAFIKTQKNAGYIDITRPMRKGKQTVNPALFLSDSLHMNATGYDIWKKAIEPYLIKS